MKKSMILLATIALMATGGATVFAASGDAGQGTGDFQQQMGYGQGQKRGMMGMMSQETRQAMQGKTDEERLAFMEERMRERVQEQAQTNETIAAMTEEEREALIQERLAERKQALADGTAMQAGRDNGLAKRDQSCLAE